MQPMGHPAYLPGHAYVQKPETVQQHPSSVPCSPKGGADVGFRLAPTLVNGPKLLNFYPILPRTS